MTGRAVLGYFGGIVTASALATIAIFVVSTRKSGDDVHWSDVGYTMLLALLNAAIAATLALLPFVVCLALGARARLRHLASRLIAGVVAGLVIEPAFVFLVEFMRAAPDGMGNATQILVAASHASSVAALARGTLQFAPWMIGYALVAAGIYHLVAGTPRQRPAVSQVFT